MGRKALPVPPGYTVGIDGDTAQWFAERADHSAKSAPRKSRYDAIVWCLTDKLQQMEAKTGKPSRPSRPSRPSPAFDE